MPDWREYSLILKDLLGLEYSPVAVSCLKEAVSSDRPAKKVRICKAILEAGKGETLRVDKKNNACFGAALHLGFHKSHESKIKDIAKKFAVEKEKLYCSYEALDNLLSRVEEPADNSESYFLLSPLEKAKSQPQLVIFIVDAEGACRLLTLAMFADGKMPEIKIGGPTCRMSIIYPLQSAEINLSFYDYTSRRLCQAEKDKLLITVPYNKISRIVESIESCSAGKFKVDFLDKTAE